MGDRLYTAGTWCLGISRGPGTAGRDDARSSDAAGHYPHGHESSRERVPPSVARTWTLWRGIISNGCGPSLSSAGSTCRVDRTYPFQSARVLDHALNQRWSRALLLVDQ